MSDRSSEWCPKRGRRGFFGIHTGNNKPRAQHESSVGKEADLISVRRVLLLMRISRQKAER